MKITRFKSRKEWSAAVWDRFIRDVKNPKVGAALNTLLSSYEKNMIVNRLAAISLIKSGKTYRQIGEELWLSPTTIRSLKRTLESGDAKGYQSYRLTKNKPERKMKNGKEALFSFADWIDFYITNFPRKSGPRWKLLK